MRFLTSGWNSNSRPYRGIVAMIGAFALGWALVASATDATPPRQILDFEMKRLNGQMQDLEAYRGKVVLVVNVASRCGFTAQYGGLQSLYERYRDRGLVILGFPSNDFGGQEPGTEAEIAKFCRLNYGVTFPMFSKIHVRGPEQHPLYARLTAQPEPLGGDVAWNFQKYLLNRHGEVVARFAPATRPEDPMLTEKIEALLEESVDAGR